jgi:hypothetical protein
MKRVARVLLGVLTLVAIGSQLVIHVRMGASPINFFSYFTNLSNLFAAVVLLITGSARTIAIRLQPLRGLSVTNMAVVGIVFTLLLRNDDLGALQPWVNFVLHYLTPCAVVLDWLLEPSPDRLSWAHLAKFLTFPAAYLVYTLVRGAAVGWYPYPFLSPERVGGYGGVAAYTVGITGIFVLVGWLVLLLGRAGQRLPSGQI